MGGFLTGFIGGMLITYAWIYPDTVKMATQKIVAQVKKLLGRK